jgi:hypothetical protein
MVHRNAPPRWREAGESGKKQLYQPEQNPVVYIVPTASILGRLPLIPVGDHGTIPAAMRNRKKDLVEYGKCVLFMPVFYRTCMVPIRAGACIAEFQVM